MREESARTDSISSELGRMPFASVVAGSESRSPHYCRESRGTVAHGTNLLSTVRCRLHIIAHMGVLDLRW